MSKRSLVFEPETSAARLVEEVRQRTGVATFDAAVILGSGWGNAADLGRPLGAFAYADWSCFPGPPIAGHPGCLLTAQISAWNVLFFAGRFHCYQGLDAFQAAFPVRLAASLGCSRILLTCAAGGINRHFVPGDFMFVDDHLNFIGDNPLVGVSADPFIDLTGLYETRLVDRLIQTASPDLVLHRGILAAMRGPCYETPAEIRFLQNAGADAVAMSIIPEAIMARYLGLQVAATAFIANHAAGFSTTALTHQDVLENSQRHADRLPRLVAMTLAAWQHLDGSGRDR
ncbi:MAG: purine-nucleoside phosphorylase [Desulfuromonadales bacterium]